MCELVKGTGQTALPADDIFNEIGNVGIGSCMASLSHIMRREVSYSHPEFLHPDYEAVSGMLGRVDESVVGIMVNFKGDVEGKILIFFKTSLTKSILEGMMGGKKEMAELDGPMLDMLKEAANIMACSYLTALASYAVCEIQVEAAAVSADMAGSILAEAAAWMTEGAVCIGSLFGAERAPRDSFMMVLLYEHSVPEFLKSLEVSGCIGS